MKYMLLVIGFHPTEETEAPTEGKSEGPTVEEFMAYQKELVDSGVMLDGSALESVDIATSVQVRADGERVVTNGPFAETREFLGGYILIDVPDFDVALDWATRCPGTRFGRVEIRPLVQF